MYAIGPLEVSLQTRVFTTWFADFSLFSHVVEGTREQALWSLFYKSTNHIHEGSTLMTSAPPKAPLPNTTTLTSSI